MGIKKLPKVILEKGNCNIVNIYKSLNDYVYNLKKNGSSSINICIDTYLYMHKYMYSTDDFVKAFHDQALRFMSKSIIPIYVFDGIPPLEKRNTIKLRADRKNKKKDEIIQLEKTLEKIDDDNKYTATVDKIEKLKKQSQSITKEGINSLKQMFDKYNIPHITAKGEADYLCAKLSKLNIVHACLTDDMDLLAHGCKRIIKIVKSEVFEYTLDKILDGLFDNETDNIKKMDKFILLCTLLGSDYSRTLPNLKIDEFKRMTQYIKGNINVYKLVYELVARYQNLDEIIKLLESDEKSLKELTNEYNTAINIFKTSSDEEQVISLDDKLKKIRHNMNKIRIQKPVQYKNNINCVSYN